MPRSREKPDGYLPLSQRPDLQIPVTGGDTAAVVDPLQHNRPKLKFNFTATIKFRDPPVGTTLTFNEIPSADAKIGDKEITFALKQATRPNPTVVYQDINQYNYRSKVATKVDYGTMQLTMYDDVEHYAHNLYEVYLKSISPIANIPKDQNTEDNLVKSAPQNAGFNGIVLDDKALPSSSSSIGPLPEGATQGIIEDISIRHWFYAIQNRRGDEEKEVPEIQYVEYQFINPKVMNMTLDELDMSQTDLSTVMMNFTYDYVYIDAPRTYLGVLETEVLQPEANTFSINDIRGKISDIQRLYRRVKRLDTIPDIPIINTISAFIPPITGKLGNIRLPKPNIDLPDIISF